MAIEAGRQRSGVLHHYAIAHCADWRSTSQSELNQMLIDADFAPSKDKEIAFYYGAK